DPTHPLVPQPCTLVIFGGSGDLARRKLIPAVYNLLLDGVLPPNYAILGNGRKPLSDPDFRQTAREAIAKYSRQKISEKVWPDFERRLFYVGGLIEDPKAYKALRQRLEQIEADLKLPGNRIFYLAKETVQNLLVLRFANSIFEPIWNHKFIDHVQITVAEAEGVGTRATYYEEAGALRDMVQNHILQLLCLVAMEPPHSLDADVV